MMRFENPCIVAHRVTAWLKKLQQNPFRPDNAKQACSKAVPIKKALRQMVNSKIQDVLEP
ncbi:hypothetical protein DCC62_19790 [candidate division KSB1 bacterium]|nr:MAG: hypothetical protein DCC62_19790 [candidate division KSB1 bacterium]